MMVARYRESKFDSMVARHLKMVARNRINGCTMVAHGCTGPQKPHLAGGGRWLHGWLHGPKNRPTMVARLQHKGFLMVARVFCSYFPLHDHGHQIVFEGYDPAPID